jgi:hypothetical protein
MKLSLGNATGRFLLIAGVILLLLLIIGVNMQIALATLQPFRPGNVLFPVQDFAEQTRAQMILGKTDQALFYLDLALQRNEDFVVLAKGEYALLAAEYLNQAIDQAISAIVVAPQEDLSDLSIRLNDLILQVDIALRDFTTSSQDRQRVIESLQAKVETLRLMLAGFPDSEQFRSDPGNAQALVGSAVLEKLASDSEITGISPQDVLFPPGSPGAMHVFYPLVGRHAELDCFACHFSGQYAGTPNTCAACHEQDTPAEHFTGDCAACHTATSWQEVNYDHSLSGARDCQFCHLKDKPADHFNGQCSACHNTVNWDQATFNHQAVGATDCLSCHSSNKPANHYSGQCSA